MRKEAPEESKLPTQSIADAVKKFGFYGAYPSVYRALDSGFKVTKEFLTIVIKNCDYPVLGLIFNKRPDSHEMLDTSHHGSIRNGLLCDFYACFKICNT